MGSAGSHIVTARDETQGMPWQAAEYVPYYGSDVKAVRGMLGAAADAATNALPKIDSAAQGTLVDFNIEELLSGMNFSDGTLSIPKIASIKQDLSDAGVVLKRVKTSIYALPQPHTEQTSVCSCQTYHSGRRSPRNGRCLRAAAVCVRSMSAIINCSWSSASLAALTYGSTTTDWPANATSPSVPTRLPMAMATWFCMTWTRISHRNISNGSALIWPCSLIHSEASQLWPS